MRLSDEQLRNLYSIAKEHWLDAQSALYAYDRAFKGTKRTSDWLKRGTIGAAVVTAISTAFPDYSWLTFIAGFGTAIIASIDQMYAPASTSQKYWDCRIKLEAVKKDLVMCAITIDESQSLLAGAEPFHQIGIRIPEITNIPTDINDDDRSRAIALFGGTVIANMLERIEQQELATENEMEADGPPEDAPDIVAAYRRRAPE